jgi:hypothetical protein
MSKFKCGSCEGIIRLGATPKKFICPDCGVLNTPVPEGAGSSEEIVSCLLPKGFEWKLPAGVIGGDSLLFVSPDDGTPLTRIEWIEIFGYDPKIKLEEMRKRGIEGVPGYINLSTLGGEKKNGWIKIFDYDPKIKLEDKKGGKNR